MELNVIALALVLQLLTFYSTVHIFIKLTVCLLSIDTKVDILINDKLLALILLFQVSKSQSQMAVTIAMAMPIATTTGRRSYHIS